MRGVLCVVEAVTPNPAQVDAEVERFKAALLAFLRLETPGSLTVAFDGHTLRGVEYTVKLAGSAARRMVEGAGK